MAKQNIRNIGNPQSLSAIIIVKKAGLSSWQKVHTPKS